ncbi:MAG TPA: PQQ-dependent sugar dehydrogenase, partial [Nitrospiraceae bacterium]|nr:PQQ-dependent sugar dehydrogenase [Nitrospiraceae bacterium]
MAGLVLISTGHLNGCSDNGSNQDSSPQSDSLRLQPISTSLSSPVFMTAPPNDSTRLFIVQQGGLIRIFDVVGGSLLTIPFLNVSSVLSTGGERGLLGMAFDPQYAANRQFYIFYTNTAGNIVIARYLRNISDPNLADSSSATQLLTVA